MLLNYQPIIDIRSRKVVKAEALARFPDSPEGLNTPDGFIPYAEHNGLMKSLTSWLFSTALSILRIGGILPPVSCTLTPTILRRPADRSIS